MKEKLKYNFLRIVPLNYFKFSNCFLLCCAHGRHSICNIECSTGAPESHFVRVQNQKKAAFFKKSFTELPFYIATVFTAKI